MWIAIKSDDKLTFSTAFFSEEYKSKILYILFVMVNTV